jgi:hypothetical protein
MLLLSLVRTIPSVKDRASIAFVGRKQDDEEDEAAVVDDVVPSSIDLLSSFPFSGGTPTVDCIEYVRLRCDDGNDGGLNWSTPIEDSTRPKATSRRSVVGRWLIMVGTVARSTIEEDPKE